MTATPIHVQVTQANISEAKRGACHCPIALAIKERSPGKRVVVAHNMAVIDGVVNRLPEAAIQFVDAFDRGHKNLTPFEFDLMP